MNSENCTYNPDLGIKEIEKVFCDKCKEIHTIVKRRLKAARLDCGHVVVYEEDTATWDVI